MIRFVSSLTFIVAVFVVCPKVRADVPIQVTVVNPGEMPRSSLRYNLTVGQVSTHNFSMEMSMGQSDGGLPVMEPLPESILTMKTRVTQKKGDSWVVHQEIVDARLGSGSYEPIVREIMLEELKKQIGFKCSFRFSNRGHCSEETVITPSRGMSKQEERELLKTFTNAAVPLPLEPVGKGASWTSVSVMDTPLGFSMKQSVTTRLVDVDPNRSFEIRNIVDQEVVENKFTMDALPQGYTAVITKHSGLGSGQGKVNTRSACPDSMEGNVETDTSIRVEGRGESAVVRVKNSIKIKIGKK